MIRVKRLLLSALLTMALGASAKSVNLPQALDLTAKMLQDGQPSQALSLLVSQSPPEGEDEKSKKLSRRYHTLAGLTYLKLSQYPKALEHLEQALKAGPPEPLLYVYLAQAYFRLARYQDTVTAIKGAKAVLDQYPGLYEIKAQSLWQLHREEEAFATLAQARQKFPENLSFLRRQVAYLLEKKLYHQASSLGLELLRLTGTAQDYAALGNALRLQGELELATRVLEQGRLRYPEDITLAKLLAHTYLAREMPFASAWILEQAARFDPSLYADAAELYRRAKDYTRALYLNSKVPEVKTQRRQRLALLLALEHYDAALAMHRELARAELLTEDAVRYALAYAAYRASRPKLVETYLDALSEPQIFRQAVELRRRLTECQDQPWRCL